MDGNMHRDFPQHEIDSAVAASVPVVVESRCSETLHCNFVGDRA